MHYPSTPKQPKKVSVKKVVVQPSRQKKKPVVKETVVLSERKSKPKASTGIGAAIGNAIMPGVGGVLGHAAESLFKTIVGKGDYKEAENIPASLPENNTIMGLQTKPVTNAVAQMHWDGQATRIAHREYIGTMAMTNGFAVAKYGIFPTSSFMFPWLCKVANRFQKWKLLGCVFEYVPLSATSISGGTPAVGQVAFGVNYDFYANLPSSMSNLLNTQGSVSCRPFDSMVCPVECDDAYTPAKPLYITHDYGGGAPDARFECFGEFIVATQGPALYQTCGQIWITYDMQLISAYVDSPAPAIPLSLTRDDCKMPTVPLELKTAAVEIATSNASSNACTCVDSSETIDGRGWVCPVHAPPSVRLRVSR